MKFQEHTPRIANISLASKLGASMLNSCMEGTQPTQGCLKATIDAGESVEEAVIADVKQEVDDIDFDKLWGLRSTGSTVREQLHDIRAKRGDGTVDSHVNKVPGDVIFYRISGNEHNETCRPPKIANPAQ